MLQCASTVRGRSPPKRLKDFKSGKKVRALGNLAPTVTASQHHSITASQHYSITASQQGSPWLPPSRHHASRPSTLAACTWKRCSRHLHTREIRGSSGSGMCLDAIKKGLEHYFSTIAALLQHCPNTAPTLPQHCPNTVITLSQGYTATIVTLY
jgi:hypothetical protein